MIPTAYLSRVIQYKAAKDRSFPLALSPILLPLYFYCPVLFFYPPHATPYPSFGHLVGRGVRPVIGRVRILGVETS